MITRINSTGPRHRWRCDNALVTKERHNLGIFLLPSRRNNSFRQPVPSKGARETESITSKYLVSSWSKRYDISKKKKKKKKRQQPGKGKKKKKDVNRRPSHH